MTVQEQKDIVRLVGGSARILVVTKENPGFDEVATALAWYLALQSQKKQRIDVVAVIPAGIANRFKFLPGFDTLKTNVQAVDSFFINIDVSKTKVKELSYNVQGSTLAIRLTPQGGNFSSKDVSFSQSTFAYDLVIVLGVPELSALGPMFDTGRELFFNTPIINIDRFASNVRFGQINAVYLTATSLAELSYPLLKDHLNKDIATCLLTGLIAATNSFQTPQVTPTTLQLASELIVAGASREEIVTKLFRTKDMNKLRVWGTVLSRLQLTDSRIVHSYLTKEETGGEDVDLQGLVDDLVLASPEAHIVLFFYSLEQARTLVYIYARENYDLPQLFQKYEPRGSRRQVTILLKKDAKETAKEIIDFTHQQSRLINQ